ncbi:unnamed protein product [Kuraishia capsulata CBS 1993]|uniref:Micro-fibrillar-associated protein 1 C-terminal domain-containing protein n=1 Tax=Kuraishia capsulata CBS 1993 TaxID=1382522 RepID=W6MU66_9ASCO|nr:uncharacterized protein KUCA_T00004892001 [Kuraishia capsulata CBS 1993]CDK28907.1 unnamed protein product [Kuraishia capsulata CBS 1993]
MSAKRYFAGRANATQESDSDSSEEEEKGVRPDVGIQVKEITSIAREEPSRVTATVNQEQEAQADDGRSSGSLKSSEESSEESSEDSSEDSSDDSSEEVIMQKPVFVSRKQRESHSVISVEADKNERALNAIEKGIKLQAEQEKKRQLEDSWQAEEDTGDIDDTDLPDDKEEYEAWRLRELQRLRLDHDRLIRRELERENNE